MVAKMMVELVEIVELSRLVEHMAMAKRTAEEKVEVVEPNKQERIKKMEKNEEKVKLVEHMMVAKPMVEKSKVEIVEPNKQVRTKRMKST